MKSAVKLLPQGISGFWSRGEERGPGVSSANFKRIVYAIARDNQMEVICTDSELTEKNFFLASCQKNGKSAYILMNSRYPYLAFADRVGFSGIHFIDLPLNHGLPIEDDLMILQTNLLNQNWQNHTHDLSETEYAHIRFWKPETVGEIIFNFWD